MRDDGFRRLSEAVRVRDIMHPLNEGPRLLIDTVRERPAEAIYEIIRHYCEIEHEDPYDNFSGEESENEYTEPSFFDVFRELERLDQSHAFFEKSAAHGWDIYRKIVDYIREKFLDDREDVLQSDSDVQALIYNAVCPIYQRSTKHQSKQIEIEENLIGYLKIQDFLNLRYGDLLRKHKIDNFIGTNLISCQGYTSGDVPAIKLLPSFDSNDESLFVIEGVKKIGFIGYEQYLGPVFRIVILAKTLELEEVALRLIRNQPENPWSVLPEIDQQRIKNTFGSKFRRSVPEIDQDPKALIDLLSCTTFADKDTIIRKMELLPQFSESDVKDMFRKAAQVRNACAHTGADENIRTLLPSAHKLTVFLDNVEKFIVSVIDNIPVEVDSWINQRLGELRPIRC